MTRDSGGGGKQLDVDRDKFKPVVSAFEKESGTLEGQVRQFQSAATDVDGAFGVLGPSLDALRNYVDLTNHTANILDRLALALDGYFAYNLSQAHHGYQSAEDDSTTRG